jgi:hypothetical protein
MVEAEASHFSEHFAGVTDTTHPHGPVQEVILPLHEEALDQLAQIANLNGIDGDKEYKRSVALEIALEGLAVHCSQHGDAIINELHFSGGIVKPRALFVFKDTLDNLSKLQRDLHCSDTILLETAIRLACSDIALQPA